MAQTRSNRNTRDAYRGNPYQHGTAARDYAQHRRAEQGPRPAYRNDPRRNRMQGLANFLAVTFLIAAFAWFAWTVVSYVGLQSELTRSVKSVASKQVELNSLRSQNDANYIRVVTSIDLGEIERIARGELGMTYAQEGQVITYSGANNDYMRKVDN